MTHLNVMIIEDDAFQRRVLQTFVQTHKNTTIYIASNGIDALSTLEQASPDIIFCDLMMPEMDGIAFARAIAKKKIEARLVLTSSTDRDVLTAVSEMCQSQGLKDVHHLSKPISQQQVDELMHMHVQAPDNKVSHSEDTHHFTETEIRSAIVNNELEPYFQVHVNAKTGKYVGAESLLRWRHPKFGVLTPIHFLDAIIDNNLSYPVLCLVLRRSIECAANWHRNEWPISIAVNATPQDICQPDFSDRVLSILEEFRFPPQRLTIEVTESQLPSDMPALLEATSRMRLNGVSISLDDFGTGHSSLTQLINSPVTELKIDQSFVRGMLESNKHMAAVKSVVALSKNLNLNVVAEGVETSHQARLLSQLGCDTLQGYFLGHPKPYHEFNRDCAKHFTPSAESTPQSP